MKLGRLNHIGVATLSIADIIVHFREVMGVTHIHEPIDKREQGGKVCFVDTLTESGCNDTQVELIEPLGEVRRFTGFSAKNPLGGQHHVCFEVEEIEAARAWLTDKGKRILGPTRIGVHGTPIFFLHPKEMMGQLPEIMETPNGEH